MTVKLYLRTLLVALLSIIAMPAMPAEEVKLTIEPRTWAGYGDALKLRAERNISQLLTNISSAGERNSSLSYDNVSITADAAQSLNMLWQRLSHFVCMETEMNHNCLRVGPDYQIRHIPVEMTREDYEGNRYRELIINFNNSGQIVRAILQPEDFTEANFFPPDGEVGDVEQRLQIVNYVETLRSYYEQKNWSALNTIYSENALIITGQRVKPERNYIKDNNVWQNDKEYIKYNVQTKKQYMTKLRYLFGNVREIRLDFSDIKVMPHPAKPQYYGVQLRQKWSSVNKQGKSYMDDGNLFLLWDFTDPSHPMIHVRKWTDVEDNVSVTDFKFE